MADTKSTPRECPSCAWPWNEFGPTKTNRRHYDDCPDRPVIVTKAAHDAMRGALMAALTYDKAIQRHAQDESWVASDELDRLYDAWISKSRAALATADGAKE